MRFVVTNNSGGDTMFCKYLFHYWNDYIAWTLTSRFVYDNEFATVISKVFMVIEAKQISPNDFPYLAKNIMYL